MPRPLCPRCATILFTDSDEARCPSCGWHDWHHALMPAPPTLAHRQPQLPSFNLPHRPTNRYTPRQPNARLTLAKHPGEGRPPAPTVSCPFCSNTMKRSYSDGHTKPDLGYQCTRRHVIFIIHDRNGDPAAWR
jgi:hypothetical protein